MFSFLLWFYVYSNIFVSVLRWANEGNWMELFWNFLIIFKYDRGIKNKVSWQPWDFSHFIIISISTKYIRGRISYSWLFTTVTRDLYDIISNTSRDRMWSEMEGNKIRNQNSESMMGKQRHFDCDFITNWWWCGCNTFFLLTWALFRFSISSFSRTYRS